MKLTILILLLLFTFAGCGSSDEQEHTDDTQTDISDFTQAESNPDETEEQAETMHDTEPVTETEPETEVIPQTPASYADVVTGGTVNLTGLYDGNPTQIFYLTDTYEDGTEEEHLSAVGAMVLDVPDGLGWEWYNGSGAVSTTDETLRMDSILYDRLVIDDCLYPIDTNALDGNGGEYIAEEGKLALDAETAQKGSTRYGKQYCIYENEYTHPETGESGTEYFVLLQMNDASMAQLKLYSYAYDSDDYFDRVLLPMAVNARTCTPQEGYLTVVKEEKAVFGGENMEEWLVTFSLPDHWLWNNSSVADDAPRMLSGRYAMKRMECCGFSDHAWNDTSVITEGNPSYIAEQSIEEARGTLESGLDYILYRRESYSEGEPLGVTWYYCEYLLPDSDPQPESEWRYTFAFLVFEDDEEGYFEKYMLPVMNSVRFYRIAEE